jgi:hypothetical protein
MDPDQQLRTLLEASVPVETGRADARAEILAHGRVAPAQRRDASHVAGHREALGVSEQEADAIVDEAMESVRHRESE